MSIQCETGSLWQKLVERTQSAIACGALHSIETGQETLWEDGLPFVVRVAKNIQRKLEERHKKRPHSGGQPFNPFLPPETALTVADISPTHLAVLNKFNVVEHHLLLITREFEHQERLLTQADFEALWLAMGEYPSLGFYNGGAAAGASQQHKHLQLVPLPIYSGQLGYPLQDFYRNAPQQAGIQQLLRLHFSHAWSRLPDGLVRNPDEAAVYCLSLYRQMLEATNIRSLNLPDGERQAAPYNLLLTRDWMLLVPRSHEFSHHISVNALGYVGSLFVMDEQALTDLRKIGPLRLLREVSVKKHKPK